MNDYGIGGLLGPVGAIVGLIAVTVAAMLIIILPTVMGAARRSAEGFGQAIETYLKPCVFPPRQLDLLALQRKVVLVALREVTVSVAGKRYMARNITVQVSPSDHWRLSAEIDGELDRVAVDLAIEVGRRAAKLGYEVPHDMTVTLQKSGFVLDGRPTRATGEIHQTDPAPTPQIPKPTVAPRINLEGETRLGATRRWTDPQLPAVEDKTSLAGADTVNKDEATLLSEVGTDVRRIAGRRTTVGRKNSGSAVDLAITHASVSTRHAQFVCDRGLWSIEDSGSRNGTYVNGDRVEQQHLQDGDRIQFSSDGPTYTFHLRAAAHTGAAETQARRSW